MSNITKKAFPVLNMHCAGSVSYTHLDVYKRQVIEGVFREYCMPLAVK